MKLPRRPLLSAVLATTASAALAGTLVLGPAPSALARPAGPSNASLACPPAARAVSFSDSLDKLVRGGAELGGLSSLAFDPQAGAWASAVDNHATDPARIWFFRDLASPRVTRDPLVLRKPDGTPYDGTNSDNEGLAVLPDGDYLVSSETEPSVRDFNREGVEQFALTVPARFRVAPAGEAASNATLEGLSVSPDGRTVYAAMEGVLGGDVDSATGNADDRRILVYRRNHHGGYDLAKEVGYRLDPGNRISEVASYGSHGLLVLEAAYTAGYGNTIRVYAAKDTLHSPDVTAISDLGNAPAKDLAKKTLLVDVGQCPSLGATSPEQQPNPILDNYEGMSLVPGSSRSGTNELLLISDDNFSAAQNTRVLRLDVKLP